MGNKKYLLIIESPAKAKSLSTYLGGEYEIVASNGHVRDLPKDSLGVDEANGFKPRYVILQEKREKVMELKTRARNYSHVFLAADPDREGEAICWHLADILERPGITFHRLRFNAITKDTVLRSIENPGTIDMQLVDAQQARRVMDRLVGYKVSTWLQRLLGRGRSAGRVQSVALRMIQEREDEIRMFVPVEYWLLTATFSQNDSVFKAVLKKMDGSLCCRPGKIPRNEEEAGRIVERIESIGDSWEIKSVKTREKSVKPPPPFITSSLQQAASTKLSMSPSVTMSIAQKLYEGVTVPDRGTMGLITYMRTDSVRISPESLQKCRKFLEDRYGREYLTPKPRRYRSSKGSQDAHEAIRPVDVELTPEKLSHHLPRNQLALYKLIWNRFVATQLRDAVVEEVTVEVGGGGLTFETSGEKLKDKGFSVVDKGMLRISTKLPPVAEGKVTMLDYGSEQKFTKPPQRFTEAKLVAEMKKVGIGRPSTYVSTIKTLKNRRYVEREEKYLKPTELGTTTIRLLTKTFPHIFEVDFTARMEDLLDSIAMGRDTYENALTQLTVPLESSLADAGRRTNALKSELEEKTGENCPECGAPLVIRWGKYGRFKSCSAFPGCRYSMPLEREDEIVYSGRKCPRCDGRLLLKKGRYGKYLGCENYPKCKYTTSIPTGVGCPVPGCGGELVEKKSRKGRIFYGCSRYPECRYALWNMPVDKTCPRCGFPLLEQKKNGLWCPSCKKKITEQ